MMGIDTRSAVGGQLVVLVIGGCVIVATLGGCSRSDYSGGGEAAPARSLQKEVPARDRDSLAHLVRKVEPSVVRINVKTMDGGAIGSGIVVSADGLVVTNFHVIEDAIEAEIRFHDGREATVVGILASDEDRDIAVLKVDKSPALVPAAIRKSLPDKGGFALALGTPQGLSFTATEGIVSAVRAGSEFEEIFGESRPGTWIQTSASISGGNSGGPLFDSDGAVQGVNTFRHVGGQNLNFAISSVDVAEVVELAKSTDLKPLPPSRIAGNGAKAGTGVNLDDLERLSKPIADAIRKLLDMGAEQQNDASKLLSQIENNREAIRAASLAGELEKAVRIRDESSQIRSEAERKLKDRLRLPVLNPTDFETGEFGYFGDWAFRVVQVFNKSTGSILAKVANRNASKEFLVHGLDLSNTVDGDVLKMSPELVFVVTGTETYQTVAGSTNTVYSIMCLGSSAVLSGTKVAYGKVADAEIEPKYSAEEQVIVEGHREKYEKLQQEVARAQAEKAAAEMRAQQEEDRRRVAAETAAKEAAENELKIKRAGSSLELAKKLIAKGKVDAARPMLERVISDAQGTDVAKAAERLLRDLK